MGRIFRDATPEQEQEFIEERRKSAFLTASKSPSRWLSTAGRHKRAADILYEVVHAAHEREMERFLAKVKQGFTGSESRILEGGRAQRLSPTGWLRTRMHPERVSAGYAA